VSDKTGLLERAKALLAHGVALISTGGTARTLADAGIAVTDVSTLTGFPEMMDGRVKTLHPGVHGGLLYRRDDPAHIADAASQGIEAIDLVWVNLYPFEATVVAGADPANVIENIDIGGPAMLRAAAKNAAFVAVATDTDDIDAVLAGLASEGGTRAGLRARLAAKTFGRTAAYDAAVSGWYAGHVGEATPAWRTVGGARLQALRYGENPHQSAALYALPGAGGGIATATQVQGKELSFNNINDADAAWELAASFPTEEGPVVAIIKHANPCGVAVADTVGEAYAQALACDPVSAFGGVIATNRTLDGPTAEAVTQLFTEVVIAPGADAAARAVFADKKNLRLLLVEGAASPVGGGAGLDVRTVGGGLLVQTRDTHRLAADDLKVVTARAPDARELEDLLFAWRVAKHVKSNAIVYVRDRVAWGIGAGQMSRVDSARIAAMKLREAAEAAGRAVPMGLVCASDAFFPFADGLLQAASAGVTAVIQPGGSIRDAEVIAAADAAGLAMVFTGVRHFRH
jgi:phosphoribosylaminoimidazolecarboxamide formyltransferase/IMP cyclohydrolase